MSTTHKTTPYAREYDIHHKIGDFSLSDYPLGYSLGLEIAEALGEALLEETGTYDLHDIISEATDSTMPVYYSQILEEWREAGCPDPEDSDHDPNSGPVIFGLMTRALYEAMANFAFALAGSDTCHTPAEALERLNEIYPYKND
jgi:hypothetical protein